MSKDTQIPTAPAPTPAPAAPRALRAAYHAGPPEVTFCGRLWAIHKPQEVSASEWEAMRARRDFSHLDFQPA